jgi:hypothetical protein
MGSHYVYLYRDRSNARRPMYVGYGMTVGRAISHARQSHNAALRAWLGAGNFDLTVAGPYRDKAEGQHVEAALISALSPAFNRSPGTGPTFVPIGVPPTLSRRPGMTALTTAGIGQKAGGALLVYLAPGEFLPDGRPKFDPADPDPKIIVGHMEKRWQIGGLIDEWTKAAASGPKLLVGVYGPNVAHRFIVGAARIDIMKWQEPGLELGGGRWRVPIKPGSTLDAANLRGRRVDGVRFSNFSHLLHIWVDSHGVIRYPLVERQSVSARDALPSSL